MINLQMEKGPLWAREREREQGTKMQARHSKLNVELLPSPLCKEGHSVEAGADKAQQCCATFASALNVDPVIQSSVPVASISHSPFEDKKMQIMERENQRSFAFQQKMEILDFSYLLPCCCHRRFSFLESQDKNGGRTHLQIPFDMKTQ